jgi:hypothetical protein
MKPRPASLRSPPGSRSRRRVFLGRHPNTLWQKTAPYLSERQWGVREGYSDNGNALGLLQHDQAVRALITGARMT